MEKAIKLCFIKQLELRLSEENNLVQVLIGPRQVGKTTTVLDLIDSKYKGKAHYESCDRIFNANAEWLINAWRVAHRENKILFIDEIQKCENWSEVIKKLYDEHKRKKLPIRCVLLGSSSLEIQKGLTESLTGRFQLQNAFHWNYFESNEGYKLNFEEYLKYGGYPGAYPFINDLKQWSDYVKTSIISTVVEKDILQYQKVKSPSLFRQAFEVLVGYPAQEISYTKLLGQIQDKGNVELIKNYIHMFEGAFLIRALEKFSLRKIKTKLSSPKILPLAPCFYFLNILDEYNSEERGRAFEVAVGAQLIRAGLETYYWREGKYEVDFVVKEGKKIWAIEVKSGRKRRSNAFAQFLEQYPSATCLVIDPDNYFKFELDPSAFLLKCATLASSN